MYIILKFYFKFFFVSFFFEAILKFKIYNGKYPIIRTIFLWNIILLLLSQSVINDIMTESYRITNRLKVNKIQFRY